MLRSDPPAAVMRGGQRSGARADVVLAIFYGVLAALFGWHSMGFEWTDLGILMRGVAVFRDGGDPYRGMVATTGMHFYYPLPTAILFVPLSYLSLPAAGALLAGLSAAPLAYGILRSGRIAFFVLTSASMLFAVRLGQLAPLIAAAVVLPGFGVVFSFKPNLGVAALSGWPRPGAIIAGLTFAVGSLLLVPDWPWLWYESLQFMPLHPAPVSIAGGAVALLAVLRWRRPEARMLLVLACLPQVMLFADQLLLTLVGRTRREQAAQWLLGWVGVIGSYWVLDQGERLMRVSYPFIIWMIYVPALVMILLRPNEGSLPKWAELIASRAPKWLRGRPAPPVEPKPAAGGATTTIEGPASAPALSRAPGEAGGARGSAP